MTDSEKNEILELENMAFKDEQLENHAFLSNEINFDKNLECFYMAYDNNKLISEILASMDELNKKMKVAYGNEDFLGYKSYKDEYYNKYQQLLDIPFVEEFKELIDIIKKT